MTKPFQGEEMLCVCCGRREVSNPTKQSNWRCIEADGVKYYACPHNFPPDNQPAEVFMMAYAVVLERIVYLRALARHEKN